jgi:type I restriction enzyme S subunit
LKNVDFDWFVNPGAVPSISMDKLRNFILPLSSSEQTAIANYLDRKTAEIDRLIANKERLIELYEEEKTAVINQAVTKGLDPDASMKPSGIDWLGDIPEHWEVKRLKYAIESLAGGGTPSTSNPSFWNGTIPWVSPKDMKVDEIFETEDYVTELAIQDSSTNLIPPERVLAVVRSGILKHTFPVAINKVPVCLNQDMKAMNPVDCISVQFFYWKLKGLEKEILTLCNKMGATVDSIEISNLMDLVLTFPTLAEQSAIVQHIETQCSRLDTIIEKFKKQIELLKEYRTTLISEVVTGKIDVRGDSP